MSPPRALWFTPFAALWYAAWLTNFQFDMIHPELLGQVYNDMLARMLRFDFSIDPNAILWEAFVRDGRSFTYFGILPALLRLPAWAAGALAGVEYGRWFCTIAATLTVALMLRAVDEAEARLPPMQRQPIAQWAMRLAITLTGPPIFLLSGGTIYNEAVLWGSALGAGFNLIVLRIAAGSGRPTPGQLVALAAIAGLAMHARVSFGVPLVLATLLLTLREAWHAGRNRDIWFGVAAVLAVLAVSGEAAAIVNFERWGSPLRFADYSIYPTFLKHPNAQLMLAQYGEISLSRLWFGVLYYITGVAYFLQWTELFGPWLTAHYYQIVAVAVPMPALIPLQLGLAGMGVWRLIRSSPASRSGRLTLAAALIGQSAVLPVVLCYFALNLRYQADMYPLIMLAALSAYPSALQWLTAMPSQLRRRWLAGILVLLLGGVATSHYAVILHKIVDRALTSEIRRAWLPFAPFAARALRAED